ncbi:MAG: glucosaminidase domain-containing protein, partial [Saprospiraceae bacterium]|nr:glucosaminidase domain-containing protein [Saprospiraceae bacterium]
MMRRSYFLWAVAFWLFLGSFSKESAKRLAGNYVDRYKEIAMEEMKRSGIPASIKLAQGMLESDLGRSPLAIDANNHFGIKCGKNWAGGTFFKHDDDTDKDGNVIQSCFRTFANPEESYVAHSE